MPSPFPGMDPYLEKRSLWPDFHASLINYVREQLQAQIRPKYNARIEERIHLIKPPHNYYPDVSIIRLPHCRIPLRAPDPDAVLDLPAVFDRTYDVSGFEDFIDYREPPPPPPSSNDEMIWLDALLREKGLRVTAE